MDPPPEQRTSATLLGRLRQAPTDQAAWDEFVLRYGRKIYSWSREWHLQEADAEDVTQAVLLTLAQRMRTFAYDPAQSFRAWLKTVTRHACGHLRRASQRAGAGSGDSAELERLHSVEAREDLVARLEAEFDRELLEEATARVRLRVVAHTWDAFVMTAQDGVSGAEVAERLGMSVAAVFVARSKVQKMLKDEVRRLEKASAAEGEP
jgi:RNA polymerase sigma-70 factor (ECF subfamily)